MQKLQKLGIIKRVGADFGGHWEIIPHAELALIYNMIVVWVAFH